MNIMKYLFINMCEPSQNPSNWEKIAQELHLSMIDSYDRLETMLCWIHKSASYTYPKSVLRIHKCNEGVANIKQGPKKIAEFRFYAVTKRLDNNSVTFREVE